MKKQASFGLKLRCFPTKLNIFHTNSNDNLKNRCHSKIILGHAVLVRFFLATFFALK